MHLAPASKDAWVNRGSHNQVGRRGAHRGAPPVASEATSFCGPYSVPFYCNFLGSGPLPKVVAMEVAVPKLVRVVGHQACVLISLIGVRCLYAACCALYMKRSIEVHLCGRGMADSLLP